MTRPLRTPTRLGSLAASAAAVLLIVSLGGQAGAADAADTKDAASAAAVRSAGPVSLFQQSLMQQQSAERERFAQPRERLERDRQAELPLDQRDAVVRRAQSSLEQLGFAPGPVDGQMGPQTRSAIRAFQRDRNLSADGDLTEALLRDLASALTEQRRVVAQRAADRSDRRSADRDTPGELRSERNTVELVDGPDTASAPAPRGGLIATAEAATAAASPLAGGEAEAATARPASMSDGEYGLGDAVVESWAIFTSVSGAMLQLLEARVAELTD